MRMMPDKLYNDFLKSYTKEALVSMIKADIRCRHPEPYARCKANCLEDIFKQLRS